MEKSLMARAIDLLSRREYSRRELQQRLGRYAESEEELTAVLDSLAERTWQSDQRFAEAFSLARGRKYGSLRLRQEMREKGLDTDAIDSALAAQDDLATARDVWQRKFGALPADMAEKARQVRFLAARGFPSEIIRQVLNGAIDELDD